MSKFSVRLRELRNSKDLSQQRFADIIGISKSSINMYERGEREPGLEMLEAFADYFNVDLDYLLGKSDIPNKTLSLNTKPAENDGLEENIVIYHRNGKTEQLKLSKEKMDMFAKMIEAFKDDDIDL